MSVGNVLIMYILLVGITRVSYNDWRKVKPRAEIYPALKTLIVTMGTVTNTPEVRDSIRTLKKQARTH